MTDILLQVNNLPQDIKTHMYGFIHMDVRISILREQYKDKFISNNSIWYSYVEQIQDDILLEEIMTLSNDFVSILGYIPRAMINPVKNDWGMVINVKNNKRPSFPQLRSTKYRSRGRVQVVKHPFYNDIASFVTKFNYLSRERWINTPFRSKPGTYRKYLIQNRNLIKKNFEYQNDLFAWRTFHTSFDNQYKNMIFKHLLKSIVIINSRKFVNRLEKAKMQFEIAERVRIERHEEANRLYFERKMMAAEEKISRKRQKTMNVQSRRRLQQQKLQQLELESAKRKADRIAKREASELQKRQILEAKHVAILKKKEEKESSRKLREKLARQREQDRMLASTTKIMRVMFTVKLVTKSKPKIDRTAQKAMKEKLKREKEYDRVDKEILKAMQAMFKITRKRSVKQSQKITNK